MDKSELVKCECTDWVENIDKIDAPITLQAIRSGGKGYDGVYFKFCPWCGGNLAGAGGGSEMKKTKAVKAWGIKSRGKLLKIAYQKLSDINYILPEEIIVRVEIKETKNG